LKYRLMVMHLPCEVMHNLYNAELYIPRSYLLSLTVCVYRHSLLHSELRKGKVVRIRYTIVQGHSKSSKVY